MIAIRNRWIAYAMLGMIGTVMAAEPAQAQLIVPDSGDTAWLLTASLLAMLALMPGLGLFLAGQVRARSAVSVMVHGLLAAAIASLLWAVAGYSIAFAPGTAWTGGALNLGLANLALMRDGMTVPESAFVLFQMVFAMTAPALLVGAFAERVRMGWFLPFVTLWSLAVFAPVAHWIWGDGWLAQLGTLDFAGGIVVNITAGVSALVLALLIGPRVAVRSHGAPMGHSPLLRITGAGLVWAGWLALAGGSALGAGDGAASAMLNMHFGGVAGCLTWLTVQRMAGTKPGAHGAAAGLLSGLVAVSASAGMIGPLGAMLGGATGALAAYLAQRAVSRGGRIDDSCNIFAIHGAAGIVGSLMMAPLATENMGGAGYDQGINVISQLVAQMVGVGAVALWSAVATLVLALIISAIVPMRATRQDEDMGLDRASLDEDAWNFD